jgi:hypothetical protein
MLIYLSRSRAYLSLSISITIPLAAEFKMIPYSFLKDYKSFLKLDLFNLSYFSFYITFFSLVCIPFLAALLSVPFLSLKIRLSLNFSSNFDI